MTAKTRAVLNSDATTNLADNTAGDISPADVRGAVKDLADSAIVQEAWENVVSAATCNIGASSSNFVNITGTTGITSFGTIGAGVYRRIKFAAALLLTHNATSLILPGAANITTVAGDVAEAVSEGSGNWRVLTYRRASVSVDLVDLSSTQTLTNKTLNNPVMPLGFNLGAVNAYVIASGIITITSPGRVRVDTEGAAATDDLVTFNGGVNGDVIIVQTATSARDVTLKDATGNLRLAGDCVLATSNDRIVLMYDSVTTFWAEISRSING